MSVCVAIAIYSVALIFFKTPIPQEFSTPKIIPYAFMIFVLLIPYTDMLAKVGKPQGPDDNRADHLAGLLKKFQQGEYLYDRPMIVLTEGYQSGIEWYLKALKHRNAPVTVSNTDSIISGNLVAIYDERQKEYVQKAYYTHHVEDLGVVSIYLVDGKK